MNPITEADLTAFTEANQWRLGRNPADGYARGWGLQFSDLKEKVSADPLYQQAIAISEGRSVVAELNRMNLFLIMRFYLSRIAPGNIIEFGTYRGGNALFMAAVAKGLGLNTKIYALDTFSGMPDTDKAVDAHSRGDFGDVDLDELEAIRQRAGLDNLTFVKGLFEDTAPQVLATAGPITLAHIDCDIYSAVRYSYECVRPFMVPGGYLVFDDATTSSCIGATEVVEALVVRRDGLNSEQVFPHFVFRAPMDQPAQQESHP